MKKKKFDCMWHVLPFAIDETFSLLALYNRKRTPFVIGPIPSPHIFLGNDESRAMGTKISRDEGIVRRIYRFIDNMTYFASKIFFSLSRMTLQNSNVVIALDNTAGDILRKRGIKEVIVCPATTNLNEFESFAGSYGKTLHLLNVSYLVERKRTQDLIFAIDKVVKRHKLSNIHLTIVGDGPQRKKIQSLIAQLKLQKYVELKGYVRPDKIADYYSRSDLFITASLSESMAAMYFEAIASGLPLIVVRNQTTEDLFEDGIQGIITTPRNPQSIADGIINMNARRKEFKKIAKANEKILKKHYDFRKNMNKIHTLLLNINSKRP